MRRYAVLLLVLVLAACNLSVPQTTPTVAPSLTPSTTPPVTLTPSATPSSTVTLTEIALLPTITLTDTPPPTQTPTNSPTPLDTETPAPTLTPSQTATGTLPPTQTPTQTDTPTATPTWTATLTDTPTATNTLPPTQTYTPLPPTPSPLPLPSNTPIPTDTPPPTLTSLPTQTYTPTIPPRPTDTATPLPSLTPSPGGVAIGPPIILTPLFQPSPTPPPVTTAAPTLDVTPTLITLEAPSQSSLTPIPATVQPIIRPLPTSAPALPTPALTIVAQAPTALPLPQTGNGTFAYALNTTGNDINTSVFAPGFDVNTFAQNPANPNQYAAVNGAGQMFFISDYANHQISRVALDIFTEFTYGVARREENDAAVDRVVWSPNGQFMAFIIHAGKVNKDGVWYYAPASSSGGQILRDCPPQAGCDTTINLGVDGRPYKYQSLNLRWSPDSGALLIELYLPDEGRRAFAISNGVAVDPSAMPPVIRYDYATWSVDGQRIVVAGRDPNGAVVLGTVDRNGNDPQVTNMSQFGWAWVQDGVDYRNRLVALGSKSGPDSPQQLVDQNGNSLSDPIGGTKPERVDWSPDHSSALVVTSEGGGRRYWVARIGEQRPREITGQVASALSVEWVGKGPPASSIVQPQAPAAPANVAPAAVAPANTSPFFAGQQIRVIAAAGLNFRNARTVGPESLIALLPVGSTMIVLEGPVDEAGLTWYRVRLDDGQEGWVAAAIYGVFMAS